MDTVKKKRGRKPKKVPDENVQPEEIIEKKKQFQMKREEMPEKILKHCENKPLKIYIFINYLYLLKILINSN